MSAVYAYDSPPFKDMRSCKPIGTLWTEEIVYIFYHWRWLAGRKKTGQSNPEEGLGLACPVFFATEGTREDGYTLHLMDDTPPPPAYATKWHCN